MQLAIVSSNGDVNAAQRVEYPIAAGEAQLFISAASYRERYNNSNEATRTQRQIYFKGISERVRWETNSNSGLPMIVRRMVVSGSPRIQLDGGVSDIDTQPTTVVQNGSHYIGLGIGPMTFNVNELLFAGTFNIDWIDGISAKIDSRRWKVHSDKSFVVRSGNAAEAIMNRRFYDPINRNIQYDDEERGTSMDSSGWAAFSSTGHQQNVYIIYQVYNPNTVTINPGLSLQRTVYWHEK